MYCPRCGKALPPDARFCGSCGSPVSTAWLPSGSNSPPPPQKVVVVAKEGCFLQTLNWGCQLIGLAVLGIVVLVLYAQYCK